MLNIRESQRIDWSIFIPALLLLSLGIFILNSLSFLTPLYILFVIFGIFAFLFFAKVDFEILNIFSKILYIFSILFLLAPIFIGTATRGTTRWIQVGSLTIQPAEIVRPLLLVFFASYLVSGKKNVAHAVKGILLFLFPTFLILIQPSLGVTILTTFGFLGVLLASHFPRKYYLVGGALIILLLPLAWSLLADYQKQRIITFLTPGSDPQGVGYNSIQAMISVGSGKISGRGLGRGIGTQLAFLPERQTDFIFASISEELGFVGAGLVLVLTFFILYRLIRIIQKSRDWVGRAYVAGFFLALLAQVVIHVGMNMALMPITGVPYPLLSAGGSSLIATMIGLGIASSVSSSST
ncbi:FtsW/RodA/SpoVE family cell cycle protein [Candidatus Woesebacteria bacterium]|nr:FtsW/RodA/SpoVE family cell cycle protein [Candidatus Woesebacteria bacterium]